MKFFVDTAEIDDIRELAETGMVDGVTTNPSLVKKSGRDFMEVLREICQVVSGPVSAEVTATDTAGMLGQAKTLCAVADNVTIKVPLTFDGLRACKTLTDDGVMVNVTLCFSTMQALLAAKAGATFVSPFVGRLDDIAQDGMQLIADIRRIYDNYDSLKTEILVASIRHPMHLVESALIGADVATLPPDVMRKLVKHPLTDKGLDAFTRDWRDTGQTIKG